MATYHWHIDVVGVSTSDLTHELVGSHAIQCCHTHYLLWVQTFLLVELGHGGDDRIHGIHYECHNCVGAVLCASLHDFLCDVGIDLEKVIPCLTRLPGHAS